MRAPRRVRMTGQGDTIRSIFDKPDASCSLASARREMTLYVSIGNRDLAAVNEAVYFAPAWIEPLLLSAYAFVLLSITHNFSPACNSKFNTN